MEMTNTLIAESLKELGDLDQGTLVLVQVQKVGVLRGRGDQRKTYGDDEVLALIWAGFDYRDLLNRSGYLLDRKIQHGHFIEEVLLRAMEQNPDVTLGDVCTAFQDTREHFRQRALSLQLATPTSTSGTWRPLEVRGTLVRGARVYHGPDGSIAPGTVYLSGVKLGQKEITPSEHGTWTPVSKPMTIAKDIIKSHLPVGLFCQYRLEPERTRLIKVGEAAAKAAQEAHLDIDLTRLPTLFKIAP